MQKMFRRITKRNKMQFCGTQMTLNVQTSQEERKTKSKKENQCLDKKKTFTNQIPLLSFSSSWTQFHTQVYKQRFPPVACHLYNSKMDKYKKVTLQLTLFHQ